MSAYDNDPRVMPDGSGGFEITAYPGHTNSPTGHVARWSDTEWEASGVIGRDVVRHFHDTADEAIRQLIGEPR